MFRKIIKFGIGLNVALFSVGCLNSKFKHTNNLVEQKYKFKDDVEYLLFSQKIEGFIRKYPNFMNDEGSTSIKNCREENVKKLSSEKFDILIIGGGSSGAGVLLDGYQKGLKCGLIEGRDFASGTSSRSTKLIHGGIRYLQDAFTLGADAPIEKLKLVFEALQERDFLISSAPFMNNIVEIKINCSKNLYNMHYYYLGVLLYQLFYFSHNLPNLSNIFPWPRIYFKERMVSFFEGQMFDSRQCLMSILTCMQNSNLEIDNKNQLQAASCANYIEFNDYIYDPNTNKIIGIKAFDKVEKKELNIYSEVVVNCTGIYADSNLNKEDKLANKLITTSKGSHMVVKKDIFNTIGISDGYMIPKTSDGRVLFILPYQKDYFLIGTTDTEMEKSTTPFVTDIDYSYLLKELTLDPGLSEENLKKAITSKWAGYRPLVLNHTSSGKIKTKSIARNHVIRNDPETGLITLMGGKWTTYRRMGEDVIHEIIKSNCKISDKAHINSKNINLNKIKLTGGYHQENLTNNEYSYNNERSFYAKLEAYLIKKYNIETKIAENLIFKYGMNSIKILEINQKISENDKYIVDKRILTAELYYSIRNELTIKPNDFLCRRTGLSFVDTEIASQALGKIIEIMGKELKWNKEKRNNEKLESGDNIKYMI